MKYNRYDLEPFAHLRGDRSKLEIPAILIRRAERILILICAFLFVISCCPAHSQHGKTLRYPVLCAGIKIEDYSEAKIQKLYGKGYFVPHEGHSGGRYYVDPKHKVTLHVEIGPDRTIDSVEYTLGVHLPVKATKTLWKQATTPCLDDTITVDGDLRLGSPVKTILQRYGKPAQNSLSNGNGSIVYTADEKRMRQVQFYEAEFRFHNSRLISMSLYHGD